MLAVRMYGYKQPLVMDEVKRPEITADQILVRVEAAGMCRTDFQIIDGYFRDHLDLAFPAIPRHEIAGSVEEIGDRVPATANLTVGDQVVVVKGCGDGTCRQCRIGKCVDSATKTKDRDEVNMEPTAIEAALGGTEEEIIGKASFELDILQDIPAVAWNPRAREEMASLEARRQTDRTRSREPGVHAPAAYLSNAIRQHDFEEIVGNSPELLKLLDRVKSAAPTDASILISGETGSGKELITRAIHNRSKRKDRPLVKVNCGAIPSGLVESELFGHVKGAFTSASERRVGRFELANGGTLFLDEVGELPLETQVKLLRLLQEQEFEPVGSSRTIHVNVRIIAATNRDLAKEIQTGGFRSDLYYRLNVIPLHVPALRDRRSDIPELVMDFLRQYAKRMGKPVQWVSRETMRLLVNYSWPGNIRELQNVIERGVVFSGGSVLKLGTDLLPVEEPHRNIEPEATPELAFSDSLEDVTRQHILRVLERTGGLISGPSGAGAILSLHPNTLRSLMHRLGIRRAARHSSTAIALDDVLNVRTAIHVSV